MRVEIEEGFRSTPYQDTLDHWTIGYGHELSHDTGETWTREYARGVLIADLLNARHSLRTAHRRSNRGTGFHRSGRTC